MRARDPDREGFVERDGARIFYEVYDNDAPTILLMQTWQIVHSRHWKFMIPYLTRHYRVVTYDGVVQVVDFGIAHASQRVHHTSAGQVKGTFPYMAPEQMTAAMVDRRVDVWALGAVLWELLTLRRLFLRDTDVNTMYAVLSGEIRPPSDHRKDVPPELDEIVLRALQRNPEERWQDAREMGKALRKFLAKQDELVGPAELADWMQELFPKGAKGKRQLMEIARTGGSDDSKQAVASQSRESRFPIPKTRRRSKPEAPPLSTSLVALAVGGVVVAVMLALDWLR